MTETLCSIDNAKSMAGANFPTSASDAEITVWINDAEAYITNRTQIDWVTLFSGLGANLKNMLREFTACATAYHIVKTDPNAYNSLPECKFIMNANLHKADVLERQLKEKTTTDFIQGI